MLTIPVSASDHVQGDASARVTLVEYGDFECPHCGLAFPIVKQVQRHFGRHLRFVFRNFPLREMHPAAEPGAETAEFAASFGRYWEMHDALFTNQAMLDVGLLFALAAQLGLPAQELRRALAEGLYTRRVQSDFLGGVHSGVNGTPTFFIDGRRHDDDFEFATLVAAIEARLT